MEEMGDGHDDMKKWIDRNRGAFTNLVWRLLDVDVQDTKLLASHVVALETTYDPDKRAVQITDYFTASIEEFDEARPTTPVIVNLPTTSEGERLRDLFQAPWPSASGELFSILVVLMTTPTRRFVRMVPLGCEPSVAEFTTRCRDLVHSSPVPSTVADLVDCINTGRAGFGTCGRKADKVSALITAAQLAKDVEETNFNKLRVSAIRTCLNQHLTELMICTLRLGNKHLTLRKTHRMRLILTNVPGSAESVVHKCEAVSITKLAGEHRTYAPFLNCESRAGTEHHDTWEATLKGTTTAITHEAKVRESVYLPVVVLEFSAQSRQYFFPLFLARAELRKAEAARLNLEQHEELFRIRMEALPRIPYHRNLG